MNMSNIFDPEPRQMGLRGDRVLWRMMTKLCFYDNFIEQLKDYFLSIVGTFEGEMIFIPELRRDYGGMSNGYVCIDWWQNDAFPLLEKRLKRYT